MPARLAQPSKENAAGETTSPAWPRRDHRVWALLASLVATCKLNGVEPGTYLTATLVGIINGHPMKRIDDLMPWRFQPVSTSAA